MVLMSLFALRMPFAFALAYVLQAANILIAAAFPVKLKPGTEKTPSTSWFALTMAAARSITFCGVLQ